jgi:hypothetical protein
MLTADERALILVEIRAWADRVPAERGFGFIQQRLLMTPAEVRDAIERETPDGVAILDIVEHSVRRTSLEEVLTKIRTLPIIQRERLR